MRGRTSLAALVAALTLTGCGGGEQASPPAETTTTETDAATTPAPPDPKAPVTIRIAVRDARTVGGLAHPTVRKGDDVLLVVRSDVAGDVHLHGYDVERRVTPRKAARIRFLATIPGRFAIELHAQPELTVGELTVRP
jgi:hypothetical protein